MSSLKVLTCLLLQMRRLLHGQTRGFKRARAGNERKGTQRRLAQLRPGLSKQKDANGVGASCPQQTWGNRVCSCQKTMKSLAADACCCC